MGLTNKISYLREKKLLERISPKNAFDTPSNTVQIFTDFLVGWLTFVSLKSLFQYYKENI